MKLTDYPKHSYSLLEHRLFDMLPKDGQRIFSTELANARAAAGRWSATNKNNTITVTMNKLIKKVQANREPFRVKKAGKRRGHHVVEYWIEPR